MILWNRTRLILNINSDPYIIYLFKVKNRNTRKDVKYVHSTKQKHRNDVNDDDVVLVFLLLTVIVFHTFF